MRRVDIVAPRSLGDEALRCIHRQGLLHLATFEAPAGVGPGTFSVAHDAHGVHGTRAGDTAAQSGAVDAAVRKQLEQVTRLGALLGPTVVERGRLETTWRLSPAELAREVGRLRPIQLEADRLTGERLRANADLERLQNYRHLIDGLSGAVGHLPRLRGYGATGIIVGTRHRALIGLVTEELEAATGGRCEVIAADLPAQRSAAVLLYPAGMAAQVSALLGGRDLEEVTLPAELQGVHFDELSPRMAAGAERLEARIHDLDAELRRLSQQHAEQTAALQLVLGDRLAEARVLHNAAHSDHLVVLSGWLPAGQVEALRSTLRDELGEQVLVIEQPVDTDPEHQAPVAVANGPVSRIFEPLSRFIAVPRYGTIDPTPLMALTFPAFVGLMVGDAGYGFVLLALLLLLRGRMRRSQLLRKVWPIGLTVAAATIAFGILFGEVFGETGRHVLGIEPILIDRRETIMMLLVVALAIGFAQVGLGLALGVVTAYRVRHKREALGRAALFVGLMTILALVASAGGLLPAELAAISVAALIAAVVIALLAMGLAGPIEMLGVVGNVLSYARLMAVGLAGVMLALVADSLATLLPSVVFGVMVALLLHALNLVLGVFDASVQSLRLHYVEFFTKFIEPGGTPYAPFTSVLGGPASTASPMGGG